MISPIVLDNLKQWLADSNIPAKFLSESVFEIEGDLHEEQDRNNRYFVAEVKYYLTRIDLIERKNTTLEEWEASTSPDKTCRILDWNDSENYYNLITTDEECDTPVEVDGAVFKFGTRWYYILGKDIIESEEDFNELKYRGKYTSTIQSEFPYLGIHGAFDLYNGSGAYSSWCQKAKYLGITSLGLCEDNTLAGTLAFQSTCEKYNIKSIIGETITVLAPDRGKYQVKLYCLNDKGWKELLRINSIINVENESQYIDEEVLLKKKTENLVCVISPEIEIDRCYSAYNKTFKHLYYQVDFVEWDSQSRDQKWLLSLKDYFDKYLKKIKPVLISDSYYLDPQDHVIRKSLNTIGRVGFKSQSKNQYFKTLDNIYKQAQNLFEKKDARLDTIFNQALENLKVIAQSVDFKIPVALFRLPQYEMTKEEAAKYEDNESLFCGLIEEGLQARIFDKGIEADEYIARIEKEVAVIVKGGYISYFLILADIINFCKREGIWVGVGRGSAAGCLISYLLGIVNLDPIQYKLLFERFLNEGRLGKSLPDIDSDFQGERRNEVKRYMEERYGIEYVTSIGTYGTFKAKAALKSLAREFGVDHQKTNYITSIIKPEASFYDFFIDSVKMPVIKEYVTKYPKVIDKLPLILDQPSNASMHAAGVVIVPKELGSIYEQMPVKKIDGVLVSEWEGEYVDKAGFLKCDILGIRQLDKFAAISRLIQKLRGVTVTFDDVNFEEPGAYHYFQNGYTEDVFQFGATGLKAYCKDLKPDNIEDLIATVALYRPGPIDTGMHKKYIRVKNGKEPVTYDKGTEEITAPTHGQIIYQEQIMEVFTHVGGFSLVEADDMRKAISKTTISREERLKSLQGFMDRFYSQGAERGYKKDDLTILWNKIEAFATYSFNRSHAACYAVTGYYCQWFKYKYPLEFWTVSLQYNSDEDKIINRISEILKTSEITVASVDINKSTLEFTPDPSNNTIYWSINSVKWVGEKAVNEILEERNKNGMFFSIEDFCDRVKGRSVNKRCIVNLIFAGAFDEVERISPSLRYKLLEKYFKFIGTKMSDDILAAQTYKEYEWTLKQKELTGIGYVDYKQLISTTSFKPKVKIYKDNMEIIQSDNMADDEVVISGILIEVVKRKYKKGTYYRLQIQDNTDAISVMVWEEQRELVEKALEPIITWQGDRSIIVANKIVIFSGRVSYYNDNASIHSMKTSKIEII